MRQFVVAVPGRELRRGTVDSRDPPLLDDGAPGAGHQGTRPGSQNRRSHRHLRLGDGTEAPKGK